MTARNVNTALVMRVLAREIAMVTAEPATEFLDALAMRDLLKLEHWVPRDSKNEDAVKAHEYCTLARAATTAMKANYFLRRAMVSSKDFMLWDDAIKGERFKPGQREKEAKTLLYEKYANQYPGDNVKAIHQLRLAYTEADDDTALFFWRDRVLIERKTGKSISVNQMEQQLQKARQRLKQKTTKKDT